VNELIINPLIKQGEESGFKRGLQQGVAHTLQSSIQQILAHRFQELSEYLQKKISSLTDIQKLQSLLEASLKIESLEELMMNGFFDE